MNRRIFLSTPLRNESENITRLYESVASQEVIIAIWVIVENGSTDGSKELLHSLPKPKNVEQLIILNEEIESEEYALGQKYAAIVNKGFEEIKARTTLLAEDLIGILDADSFPEPGYYRQLSKAFDSDLALGIASGTSRDVDNGKASIHASDWVRGSCRLWRGACMLQSGYIIGPSADTLSLARAEIDGWLSKVIKDALFIARGVGTRSKQHYYGSSAYFRGNTLTYILVRFIKFVMHGRLHDAQDYLKGYMQAWRSKAQRIEDAEIFNYFQTYLTRKLLRKIGLKDR